MSTNEHFVSERQALILGDLRLKGRVIAQELAQTFGVSEDTVRRDLREMAARGECERVYGGALLSNSKTVPLKTRIIEDGERKSVLGKAASGFLSEDMVVFIDAGSTNLAIAQSVPEGLRVKIITNTPAIAAELSGRADVDLIVIGGKVDPAVGAAIDATALRQLEQMRPDLCILGACGITLENGLAADVFEDAVFKRLASTASNHTLIAATSEKLGHRAAFHVRDLAPPLTIILEPDADAGFVDALRMQGLQPHLAGSPVCEPLTIHS